MAAMSISPFLRSPVTDITGGLISHQLFGKCARQEMQAMECIEAYGLDRGIKKCQCYIEEYRECQTMEKQFKRFIAMRNERDKQIKEGKLCGDERYLSPRLDSY